MGELQRALQCREVGAEWARDLLVGALQGLGEGEGEGEGDGEGKGEGEGVEGEEGVKGEGENMS